MSIDDDDVERAGTRSRRQLSTSKPYSVYPPDHNSLHLTKKQSPVINRKSRPFIFTCIITVTVLLFILFLSNSKSPAIKINTKSTLNFEESTDFKDSSQFTDYELLNRLLTEKKGKCRTTPTINKS
jgi:hypothetical protein